MSCSLQHDQTVTQPTPKSSQDARKCKYYLECDDYHRNKTECSNGGGVAYDCWRERANKEIEAILL